MMWSLVRPLGPGATPLRRREMTDRRVARSTCTAVVAGCAEMARVREVRGGRSGCRTDGLHPMESIIMAVPAPGRAFAPVY